MAENRVTWCLPQLGNGVDTAIVQEWLVEVGEAIAEGDPLVVVETDKATSDLESPVAGTLIQVLADEGTEVEIGQPLADLSCA